MDSALTLHRLTFAFRSMYHYLFPQLTMGLAPYIAVLKTLDARRGDPHYGRAAFLARNEPERRALLATIGPVWDGNEVWLISAGATLFVAFPALYAASFSGFFLPLMIVLWLLMGRGIALEFRRHLDHAVWRPFRDFVFSFSSALLAFCLGAALGNVVRGVPFDASGRFFVPLWTSFRVTPAAGFLDWYTLLAGLLSLCTLTMHGSFWAALKRAVSLGGRAVLDAPPFPAGEVWAGRVPSPETPSRDRR
jgi:cytochrome d ubiquinol oxidase subunit II